MAVCVMHGTPVLVAACACWVQSSKGIWTLIVPYTRRLIYESQTREEAIPAIKNSSTKGACIWKAGHTQGNHNARKISRGLPPLHPNPTEIIKAKTQP